MADFCDMDPATLRQALKLVHRHTGITMVPAKQSMLQARMRQRMRALRLGSYEDYIRHLGEDASEHQPFIDVVTTHHTAFFRTPRIWRYVREDFLPAWAKQHTGKTLRVWSAAASSGEEANSIAMCCEELKRRHPEFSYEITGTDIAANVLEHASIGEYSGTSVCAFRATHPELFERYNCLHSSERFQLEAKVRKRITYSVHNLLDACPWRDRFDLIFLRNVLIYFKKDVIETVLRNIAPALREGGLLIIGEAESLAAMEVPFRFLRPQIYRRAPK